MNEKQIKKEIRKGMKEVDQIRSCIHRWLLHEKKPFNEYTYRCEKCGAVQFGQVKEKE